MKLIRRATAALAALVSMTSAAQANEWKMATLSAQVDILPEARELQDTDRREFLCLALVVFHESRGESLTGKRAVAHVVLNRRNSGNFPNTLCAVTWQRSQFSWTTRPVGSLIPRDRAMWTQSQEVALDAIAGRVSDPTSGAMYFHATREKPNWRFRGLRMILGGHVFLRR